MIIKKAERGEHVSVKFSEKLIAARSGSAFKVGIVMDDKTIILELPWTIIKEYSEVALAEYVLKLMKEKRDNA